MRDYFERNDEIKAIEKRLESLKQRYNAEKLKLEELRDDCKLENKDVIKLEHFSLNKLFLKLAKRYDKRLDEEEKEAYMAQARYDACKFELNLLEADIIQSEDELQHLLKLKSEFTTTFNNNYRILVNENEIAREKNKHLKESTIDLESLKRANKINNRVKREVRTLIEQTKRNDVLGIFTKIGGGLLSSDLKYAKLDEIKKMICKLEKNLKELHEELFVINLDQSINLVLDDTIEYINLFLDCIFYGIDDNVNLESLNLKFATLLAKLNTLSLSLKEFIKIKTKEVNKNQKDLDKYIAECTNI